MKIVFLDIDGVMQPYDAENRFYISDKSLVDSLSEKYHTDYHIYSIYDVMAVYYDWHEQAIARLKNILDKTGAKIIISSDWRSEKTPNKMPDLLIIDGGSVVAIAKQGADSGLDSNNGTYINGGTVLATTSMMDQISMDSKQRFISLSYGENMNESSLVALLDGNDLVFAFRSDRTYSGLVFSSDKLTDKAYYLYKDGEVDGTELYGLFIGSKYTKGTQLAYTSNDTYMGGGQDPMQNGEGQVGEPPEKSEGDVGEPPQGEGGEPPEKPDGDNGEPPEKPEGEQPPEMIDGQMPQGGMGGPMNPINKEFTLSGISNYFTGIGEYVINEE